MSAFELGDFVKSLRPDGHRGEVVSVSIELGVLVVGVKTEIEPGVYSWTWDYGTNLELESPIELLSRC